MIRLHQLSFTPEEALLITEDALRRAAARKLGVKPGQIAFLRVSKRSRDARREGVRVLFTVDVDLSAPEREAAAVKGFPQNQAACLPGSAAAPRQNVFTLPMEPWKGVRPVVVGMGPAGLFCALALAARGAKPLVLERGEPVEKRAAAIDRLEAGGALDENSNVLFGEGGAGAFSDGKLTCGVNSPLIAAVLETLALCGAPESILIDAKPHIGTDVLRRVLVNARAELLARGAEIRFGATLTGLVEHAGRLAAIRVRENGAETELDCSCLFLAMGHSARDTYRMLRDSGVRMEQKPFAAGVRVEHHQAWLDRAQFGDWAGHPALGPADYKLNIHTPDGRGVYSFCMCPGGRVINASSAPDGVNVNGMSLHARDGENCNAALLVGVSPADFGGEDPLAGIELQRRIEQAARRAAAAGEAMLAPCQRVEDFLRRQPSHGPGDVSPSYRPGVVWGEMDAFLPGFIADNLRYALPLLGRKLRGFDCPDALLTGPETRSSSPVRILRDQHGESSLPGLFPLGEGAGYAGGIVSAAVDGLKAGRGDE